ncbi:MAG: glycosyltransferase family 4 protein [Novosphingobium sp.]|nr:glycosyltransferase family 4 protein [Novosphingobium sp.]
MAWYGTSIFYDPDRWPYRIERYLPGRLRERVHGEFLRFNHPGLDRSLVRTGGSAEWLERIANRARLRKLARRIDTYGNRRFVNVISGGLNTPERLALWGFNGSSLETFEHAATLGHLRILDRTIGDARAYNASMDGFLDQFGEWFLPNERAFPDSTIASDQAEYELANCILVGSEFAAATVREHGGEAVEGKVRVLPYCFDEALFSKIPSPAPVARDQPLKMLFIGQANPRKGVHHLLDAISRIPVADATLTMVGDLRIPQEVFARHADRVKYLPTVPRAAIPAIMADHHVLVFPSYFEGSALSLLEALASGMAIIQTRASGNGVTPNTGILLEQPDTDALHQAMLYAVANRDRVDAWRSAAQSEAKRYSFACYRENVGALLDELSRPS